MTETASFTAVAHFGQAASSSTTTAGFPGKSLQVPPANNSGPSLSLHSHRQNNNSSKLPSFRYADIKHGAALSSLLPLAQGPTQPLVHRQQLAAPSSSSSASASSASANPLSDASPSLSLSPDAVAKGDHHRTPTAAAIITPAESSTTKALPAADQADTPLRRNLRSRASSYQTHLSPITDQHPRVRRPASFPDSLVDEGAQSSTLSRAVSTKNPSRRAPASRSSNGAATSAGPPSSLTTQRRQTIDAISPSQSIPDTKPAKDRTHDQREFLLAKTLSPSSPTDASRDQLLQRPPVSYKPPVNSPTSQSVASTPVRVPPIRTFRSSGSRKSLGLDMNFHSRSYDTGDNYTDSNNDNTLRAVDGGRHGSGIPQPTPSASSRQQAASSDDTGDVFLKIASEETSRRTVGENVPDDNRTSSRANRSSHRRPLSTIVSPYHQTSPPPPPRINRRLSDQQDRGRSGRYDDDLASEVVRTTTYRQLGREKAASAHPGEDTSARTGSSSLRPSPMTPRSLALQQEQSTDNSPYGRRRSSVTDNNSLSTTRTPAHKAPVLVHGQHGQNKTYNASPLNRSFDFQGNNAAESGHQVEGTESTSSITAPSTVWDELDDLKSRIHRLELTGKLPSTSGAAVMRASEDRPATATTTVTTMSLSPKKSGIGYHTEVINTNSSQRDTHPHLHSALAKTKSFLNPEVYRALETAANDALALSSIMGAPGQPGPISSAASVIGMGPTITDRQLRRRADSVCRSLTELCIALGEGTARTATAQPTQLNPASQSEGPVTPTVITKSLGGLSASRRPSIVTEQNQQMIHAPRPMSKFEERRSMILNGGNIPAPRHSSSTPSTPNDANMRRSSLVVARTRRAGTEEPEDGRRSSALVRTRRAGTEEPDEGRKTSFLVRGRHGTGEDSEEARFRAPSRATTEVNGPRGLKREYVPDPPAPKPDARAQAPSALGRRRFISSNLHSSRLATPLSSSTVTPTRKYSEVVLAPEGNSPGGADKPSVSRHLSLSQRPLQNRTSSLYVRRPNSLIPPGSSAGADGYR